MLTDSSTDRCKTFKGSVARIIALFAAIASVFTVAAFFDKHFWPCELISHFRVQYFVAFVIAAICLALLGRRRFSLVFGCFALINLAVILPMYFGKDSAPAGGEAFRVVMMNVRSKNRRIDLVTDFIKRTDPDVIVMEEITGRWMAQTQTLAQAYPYVKACPREDNFGIALFSKRPFTKCGIAEIGNAGVPTVYAELEIGGRPVFFIGTHLLPPASPAHRAERDGQLMAIPDFVRHETHSPVVVLGDMNATPWCHSFKEFLRASGLKDSAKGWGVQCSWPTFRHMIHMRIPIDHCLVSPEISVVNRRIGPDIGSDHFPLIADLVLQNALH